MEITRPAIVRLARKSGIKSISDDCYEIIQNILKKRVEEVINTAIIVNTEHQTKTLMVEDLYNALKLLDVNLAQTTEIGKFSGSK